MYKLRDAKIYYGARSIPMQNVVLPETILDSSDVDLDDLAEQLNRFVFKYGNPKSWKLEVGGTSPEQVEMLNKQLAEDTKFDHLPRFQPTITISGRGISIVYEGSTS